MKFNFKKITAVTASFLVAGLTLGTATAANYPAPFKDNGSVDAAIVYGSDAASTDQSAAATIQNDLDLPDTVTTDGDSFSIERSTDRFNLGENMSGFYPTIDNEDFDNVLADGTFLNDNNNEYDYEQEMDLPDATLEHFSHNDYEDETPTVGFHFTDGEDILNYTLDFTGSSDAEGGDNFDDLEDSYIEILGQDYFISEANNNSDQLDLVLLDSANSATLDEGEETTMEVGGSTYTVTATFVGSGDARLEIDGESTNSLEEGDSYKLGNGLHVGVQEILSQDFSGGTRQVEFSLGSGEIYLPGDGSEVEINDDEVSTIDEYDGHILNSYIGNSSDGDWQDLTLEWEADDELFLTGESSLTMPGFGSATYTSSDLNTEAEEMTTFNGGDTMGITTTVEDGELDLPLFHLNSSDTGFGTNLGDDGEYLVTGGQNPTLTLNASQDSYFVASLESGREAETYAFQISSVEEDNGEHDITLDNMVDGSEVVIEEGDSEDVGRIQLTHAGANESTDMANVTLGGVSGNDAYADRVFTEEGLKFLLPVDATDTTNDTDTYNQNVNLVNDTSWGMSFTEEDEDGNIAEGGNFSVEITTNGDNGFEATNPLEPINGSDSFMLEDGNSDEHIGYVESSLATRIDWTDNTGSSLDDVEVTYHGEEAYADVAISESAMSESSGNIIYTDDESSSYEDSNVIVVGGSAVNSAAAEVLGVSYPTGGSDFTDETGVGQGEYLVRSYTSPWNEDKVALLVAGYSGSDTQDAANWVTSNDFDSSTVDETGPQSGQ